jgi:hypothetical protein
MSKGEFCEYIFIFTLFNELHVISHYIKFDAILQVRRA